VNGSRTSVGASARSRPVSLLTDLDAFYAEDRLCGHLDGDATDGRAWMACVACGARIERSVETRQPS